MQHSRLAALVAIVVLSLALSSAAAQDRPTFRGGVALVPITAVVRDAKSRLVRDLARDDFVVFENRQPRPILDFRASDEGPVSLALLVDTSGSMRGVHLAAGKHIVDRLVSGLRGGDEAALFTFDKTLRQATPFTPDPAALRGSLTATDGWGLTSVYDAIAESARRLAERRAERRAVIVITDGIDTSSALAPAEVSGMASAIDVPVYVVAVTAPPPESDVANTSAVAALSDLAFWTGGDLLHAPDLAHADRAVAGLMAELRQQYFLAIESSALSGWHRLEIATRRRDLRVRTRSGYFSTPVVP